MPGNADGSLLIQAISYDPELEMDMPPTERLPESTVALFKQWIDAGAHDPRSGNSVAKIKSESKYMSVEEGRKFWAYKTPVPPRLPQVRDTQWAEGAIDRFVLHGLERKGLRSGGDADRYTLLRRVTYDLTGLPPTIAEIEDFVGDSAPTPKALAKVVDRLLESDAFGERWAGIGWTLRDMRRAMEVREITFITMLGATAITSSIPSTATSLTMNSCGNRSPET